MKVEQKKSGDCRVKLAIALDKDECKEEYDKVYAAFMKNAALPGFRRGKAPLAVLKSRLGGEMQQRIESAIISRYAKTAIDGESLNVARVLGVEECISTYETGASITVVVDVKPEFKLPKYEKLPVKAGDETVSDDEVAEALEQERKMHATSEESDGEAKDGDYLELSFEATAPGGKPLEGIPEDAIRYVKSANFWVEAGPNPKYEAIPGIASKMVGLKKGDTFALDVKFPSDFHIEALRKVKASYQGSVNVLRAVKLPSDEELAKARGADSLDDLRKNIKDAIAKGKERAETARIEKEIGEHFLKKASFAVPESDKNDAVRRCADDIIMDEAGGQDLKKYAEEHAEELRKKIEEKALSDVRLKYILEAIADDMSITVSDGDVDNELSRVAAYMAARNPKNAPGKEELRRRVIEQGAMEVLTGELKARKAMERLVEQVRAGK